LSGSPASEPRSPRDSQPARHSLLTEHGLSVRNERAAAQDAAKGQAKAGTTAQPAGNSDIYAICDDFIGRCKAAILARDVAAARDIRNQASQQFEALIPGWHQALMGQFTGFYLDDAEMILAKLSIFRANRDAKKPLDYVNLTRTANRIMTVHETFERVLAEAGSEPVLAAAEQPLFTGMLRQLQGIMESPLDVEERWDRSRPFLLWVMSLQAPLARHVLPLLNYVVR